VDNARTYNIPEDPVHKMATELEADFKEWLPMVRVRSCWAFESPSRESSGLSLQAQHSYMYMLNEHKKKLLDQEMRAMKLERG
jgi:hypothetical protein